MFSFKRGATIGVAITAMSMSLAACGGSAESSSTSGSNVDFLLNFAGGGYHAGFAAASKEGFYKDAGLKVKIQEGNGSTTTAQLLASRKADIGYAASAAIMQVINQGAPLKIIATISQVDSSQVTALKKTGISSISDLKGHSVGVPQGSAQVPLVPLLLKANGLSEKDVDLVNLPSTSMVPSLLEGKVDSILGSTDSYGIQLAQQGAKTDDYLFADNGVAIQGVSIFANEDWLKGNGDTAKKFVAASLKGWDFAIKEPAKAVKDVTSTFPRTKADQVADELEVTPPLFCKNGARVIGKSEPDAWATSYKLLTESGLLKPDQDPKLFYTYDFLPPENEMTAC